MNKYIFLVLVLLQIGQHLFAQTLNWASIEAEDKHFLSLVIQGDYSMNYGVAYGYKLPTPKTPMVLGIELNSPFGNDFLDDWRSNVNLHMRLWERNGFAWSLNPGFVTKNYTSEVANLNNVGFVLKTQLGYYKARGSFAADVSYERTLFSKIAHTGLKAYYPAIRDGWYSSTGANIKVGATLNYSFRAYDLFLSLGKPFGQDFKNNPTLPFYADLRIQKRF